jgi:hypothetical protein
MATHRGKLDLSPEASTAFNDWTDRVQRSVADGNRPRELQPFYSRLQTMALKIAGLYYLSTPLGSAISGEHMAESIALARALSGKTSTLLTESIAYSPEGARANLVVKALREGKGRLSHVALTNRVKQHMGARQLTETLQMLLDAQRVREVSEGNGGRGRPPRIIELVEVEN